MREKNIKRGDLTCLNYPETGRHTGNGMLNLSSKINGFSNLNQGGCGGYGIYHGEGIKVGGDGLIFK